MGDQLFGLKRLCSGQSQATTVSRSSCKLHVGSFLRGSLIAAGGVTRRSGNHGPVEIKTDGMDSHRQPDQQSTRLSGSIPAVQH